MGSAHLSVEQPQIQQIRTPNSGPVMRRGVLVLQIKNTTGASTVRVGSLVLSGTVVSALQVLRQHSTTPVLVMTTRININTTPKVLKRWSRRIKSVGTMTLTQHRIAGLSGQK